MKEVIDFLKRMRYLVNKGACRFEERNDYEKTYLEILIEDFNITLEDAWTQIKYLNQHMVYFDDKPDYYDGIEAYIFKKEINNLWAYIKLKIEIGNNGEELVVISFRKDKRRNR